MQGIARLSSSTSKTMSGSLASTTRDRSHRPVRQFSRLDFKAKKISVGNQHTLFIDLESNFYGQLGLGDRNRRNRPVQILGIKAKEVTAGESFSALIDDQDRVWVFGWNKRGQLGLPLARYPGLSPEQRIERSPVQIPEIRAKKIAGGGDWNDYFLVIQSFSETSLYHL